MASDMDKASLDHCAREGQEPPDQTCLASRPSQLWECAPKLYKHILEDPGTGALQLMSAEGRALKVWHLRGRILS